MKLVIHEKKRDEITLGDVKPGQFFRFVDLMSSGPRWGSPKLLRQLVEIGGDHYVSTFATSDVELTIGPVIVGPQDFSEEVELLRILEIHAQITL